MENEPQAQQPQAPQPTKPKRRRKAKRKRTVPAAAIPAAPKDALDLLAGGDPKKVMALMLWRDRFRNPDMSVQISEQDLRGFEDCVTYLNVTPDVTIVRPQGRPKQDAVPAAPGKRAIPARPAEPARPYVFVGVVAKGTMDSIKPIENNEEDAGRRDEANAIRRFKEKGPQLAALLLGMCQSGTFSNAEITEAAQALQVLARS